MSEDRITEILSKIKNTVGENNYKLALAITGHRPGKIRDVSMSSKDGELLLEYITQLQNNWNELKEIIEQDIRQCEELIEMCPKELRNTIIGTRSYEEIIGCNKYILSKMQELENRKV